MVFNFLMYMYGTSHHVHETCYNGHQAQYNIDSIWVQPSNDSVWVQPSNDSMWAQHDIDSIWVQPRTYSMWAQHSSPLILSGAPIIQNPLQVSDHHRSNSPLGHSNNHQNFSLNKDNDNLGVELLSISDNITNSDNFFHQFKKKDTNEYFVLFEVLVLFVLFIIRLRHPLRHPLHLAISVHFTKAAKWILELMEKYPETLKAALTAKDEDEKTPLHIAIRQANKKVAKMILELIKDHPETLKAILTAKDEDGNTPLHLAISVHFTKAAKWILELMEKYPETLKAILTAKDKDGYTPLDYAIFNNNTGIDTMILDSIKDHPETLKAILTAKYKNEKTPLYAAISNNNTKIAKNIINFFSPKKALELLLMTDNNGDTVFHSNLKMLNLLLIIDESINRSHYGGRINSLKILSSIGAGYTYVDINNEDELSSKAGYFASAAFIVVNRPDLKKQIPKEHQNKIISLTEKNEIEDMIRSMTFSNHVTDAKVFKAIEKTSKAIIFPRELTNIIAEYTPSTIEQLKFWECLRKVPYHQNKEIYKKRLKFAKLIIEYNNKFKDITKELQQYYVNELNAVIQTLELKDKEWNPRAWAESFGYKITVQATSSNPEEEKQNHDTPSSDLFKQKPTEQATGDHEHEAQNITDPRPLRLT